MYIPNSDLLFKEDSSSSKDVFLKEHSLSISDICLPFELGEERLVNNCGLFAESILLLRDSSKKKNIQYNVLTDETPAARFARLAKKWYEESGGLSFARDKAMLPSYRAIIDMGLSAVPLILMELQRKPHHWFVALRAITGTNPVSPDIAGRIDLMAAAWIEWGKNNNIIE